MKKISGSSIKYVVMCIVFIVALIVIAMSASFAYYKAQKDGTATQTKLRSNELNITSNLNEQAGITINDLQLIHEEEIPTTSATINFTVTTANNAGELEVYLKDISIATGLIDTYGSLRWQLLDGTTVIANGSFNDIETNGVPSTSQTNTATTLYFDKYNLKTGISIPASTTKSFTIRIYLLDDPNNNQIGLTNLTFSCKAGVVGYKSNN